MEEANSHVTGQSVISPEDMVELERIDMSRPEEELIPLIMNNLRTVGFLTLENVVDYDEGELFQATRAFFHDIPQEEQRKLLWKNFNPENNNVVRGKTPFSDNSVSHKEMYDVGGDLNLLSDKALPMPLYEDTPFPPQEEYQWILTFLKRHYNRMHEVSLKLCEYIAIGLGKDRYFFHDWWKDDSLSTVRIIHYMPRNSGVTDVSLLDEEQMKLTGTSHVDACFITVLSTLGYPGLQVLLDGEYKSVKPTYNSLVVNLGQIFEHITNFQLKATRHRVVDIGIERFSVPYGLFPKYLANIPSNLLEPEEQEQAEPIVFGQWILKTMFRNAEWAGFILPEYRKTRFRNQAGEIVFKLGQDEVSEEVIVAAWGAAEGKTNYWCFYE